MFCRHTGFLARGVCAGVAARVRGVCAGVALGVLLPAPGPGARQVPKRWQSWGQLAAEADGRVAGAAPSGVSAAASALI